MPNPINSVTAYRGQQPETIHALDWVQVDTHGQIQKASFTATDKPPQTWIRSTAKPFQAAVSLSHIEKPLRPEHLALMMASHVATPMHVQLVQILLDQFGLDHTQLYCGAVYPVDETAKAALIQARLSKSPLYHNCSGKHAGLLCACVASGLDVKTYCQPEHPLQQEIIALIESQTDKFNPDQIAIDGCGLPVFSMPFTHLAKLYAGINRIHPKLPDIIQAAQAFPELIGGETRIDSNIVAHSNNQLFAKVGAEGLIAISHLEKGQGLVLKIWDGNQRIRDLAILQLLQQVGWISSEQVQAIQQKNKVFSLERHNDKGTIIGHYHCQFG